MRHFTIEIDDEVKMTIDRYFPKWGTQAPFFRILINDALMAMANEKHREKVIGGVMSGRIKGYQISSILKVEEDSKDDTGEE